MPDRQTVTVGKYEYKKQADGWWWKGSLFKEWYPVRLEYVADILSALLAMQTERDQAVADVGWLVGKLADDHYAEGCVCDMCQVLRRIDARYPQEKEGGR